jgi:hypothetical protein
MLTTWHPLSAKRLALTSPISDCRSVGIVRSRTQATKLCHTVSVHPLLSRHVVPRTSSGYSRAWCSDCTKQRRKTLTEPLQNSGHFILGRLIFWAVSGLVHKKKTVIFINHQKKIRIHIWHFTSNTILIQNTWINQGLDENCIMRNFVNCILSQTQLECSSQGGRDVQDMYHKWEGKYL